MWVAEHRLMEEPQFALGLCLWHPRDVAVWAYRKFRIRSGSPLPRGTDMTLLPRLGA